VARKRLSAGASQEYERGYRAALASVDERSWRALDGLARKNFDLVRWAESWKQGLSYQAAYGGPNGEPAGFDPPDWFAAFADDLGDLIAPLDFPRWSFTPTGPFVRGYAAALRDVWDALERSPERDLVAAAPEPALRPDSIEEPGQ
jgi:hypothetical protein